MKKLCQINMKKAYPINHFDKHENEDLHPYICLTAQLIFYIFVSERNVLPSVPRWIKSNAYFVIDNEENVKRIDNNEYCVYHDDCGAWGSPN